MTEKIELTIVGAGAIGGVVGAYLIKGGHDVVFIDVNEDHVTKINEQGITIEEKDNKFNVSAKAYTLEQYKAEGKSLKKVILAVKALHTQQAVKGFADLLEEDGYVVSFQNGLNEELIAEIIGEHRTLGCFINLFADYLEPGVISYGGVGSLYIGELDGQKTERIQELHRALQSWGDAQITDNILGYLWSKLAYGSILTASATTNLTIAEFIEDMKYRPLVVALGQEVLKVADKKGIEPKEFDDWKPYSVYPEHHPEKNPFAPLIARLRSYTKTRTGIWRDLAVRKRKTEVPQQLNPIIAEGQALGFEMPLLQQLVQLITEIENGNREIDEKNLDELFKLIA